MSFEFVQETAPSSPEREAMIDQIVALKSLDLIQSPDELSDMVRNGCVGLLALPDQALADMLEQLWNSAR